MKIDNTNNRRIIMCNWQNKIENIKKKSVENLLSLALRFSFESTSYWCTKENYKFFAEIEMNKIKSMKRVGIWLTIFNQLL